MSFEFHKFPGVIRVILGNNYSIYALKYLHIRGVGIGGGDKMTCTESFSWR